MSNPSEKLVLMAAAVQLLQGSLKREAAEEERALYVLFKAAGLEPDEIAHIVIFHESGD